MTALTSEHTMPEQVQLTDLVAEKGITLTAVYHGGRKHPKTKDRPAYWTLHWTVILHYQGRHASFEYSAGIGHALPPRPLLGLFIRSSGAYVSSQDIANWPHGRSMHTEALRQTWLADQRCAKTPAVADVLSCVCCDARAGGLSFDDFCSEFGYDNDSRAAEKTWNACREAFIKVRVLLGSDFDDFANAEH